MREFLLLHYYSSHQSSPLRGYALTRRRKERRVSLLRNFDRKMGDRKMEFLEKPGSTEHQLGICVVLPAVSARCVYAVASEKHEYQWKGCEDGCAGSLLLGFI